ncbi:MAG: hypothetical protein Kow00104_09060 [Rhodothalassiaceae bacterium]
MAEDEDKPKAKPAAAKRRSPAKSDGARSGAGKAAAGTKPKAAAKVAAGEKSPASGTAATGKKRPAAAKVARSAPKASSPAAQEAAAPTAAADVHEATPMKKSGTASSRQILNDRAPEPGETATNPADDAIAEEDSQTRHMLDLFWRLLGLTGFAFLSNILLVLIWILAGVQYLFIAIGRKPESQLEGLIDGLAAWFGQIFDYMAGRGKAIDLPFPFSEFPAGNADGKS